MQALKISIVFFISTRYEIYCLDICIEFKRPKSKLTLTKGDVISVNSIRDQDAIYR